MHEHSLWFPEYFSVHSTSLLTTIFCWHDALFFSAVMWWKLRFSSLGKLHQNFCQLKFLLSLWKSCFTRQKLSNWTSLIARSEYPSDITSDLHLQSFLPLKVNLCFCIFSAHLVKYEKLHQYLYCKIWNSTAILKEILTILWDEHFPFI